MNSWKMEGAFHSSPSRIRTYRVYTHYAGPAWKRYMPHRAPRERHGPGEMDTVVLPSGSSECGSQYRAASREGYC